MKNLFWTVLIALTATLSGCSDPIPTSDFEALKTKTCACTKIECTDTFVTDLHALKHRGGSPQDAEAAKTLLTEATVCARKIDPDINKKIVEALKK